MSKKQPLYLQTNKPGRCSPGLTYIRIWIMVMEESTKGSKYLTTATCAFLFIYQYRHLATLQGRVGRRDQAGDIKCLWSCLRPVISSQQSLSPFDPLTPLSPSPTPPIRPIHSITTGTKLSIRHILRSLEIATPHIREPKINLPSIRIV